MLFAVEILCQHNKKNKMRNVIVTLYKRYSIID